MAFIMRSNSRISPITIYTDGAIGNGRQTGIAAIAKNGQGHFLGWVSQQRPAMTNNEAEYQAVLLGLQLAKQLNGQIVEILSDSATVVWQMQGRSRVNSSRLKPLHQQICIAIYQFQAVSFQLIKRTENNLADALANDALSGRVVAMPIKSV